MKKLCLMLLFCFASQSRTAVDQTADDCGRLSDRLSSLQRDYDLLMREHNLNTASQDTERYTLHSLSAMKSLSGEIYRLTSIYDENCQNHREADTQ